jgi:hypothetical protein
MRTTLLLTLVASVWLPSNTSAQQMPAAADDARARVAPLHYQTIFKDQLQSAETKETPDTAWIKANREVQTEDSMGAMDMGGAAMKSSTKPGESREDHSMHKKGK